MSDEVETPEAEEAPKPRRKKAARKKVASTKGMRRKRRERNPDGTLQPAGEAKLRSRYGR